MIAHNMYTTCAPTCTPHAHDALSTRTLNPHAHRVSKYAACSGECFVLALIYIDRINVALDVDVKERIESDQLIEKLAISRLDNMQRKLVAQIEAGFKALQVRFRRTNLQNHPQACVGLQKPGTEICKVHHEPC